MRADAHAGHHAHPNAFDAPIAAWEQERADSAAREKEWQRSVNIYHDVAEKAEEFTRAAEARIEKARALLSRYLSLSEAIDMSIHDYVAPALRALDGDAGAKEEK